MKTARLTLALALGLAATACTAERALAPQAAGNSVATVSAGASQVPYLFVVDGVRLKRDQVPALTRDEIAEIRVIKGNAALKQYGQDGSYGVVEITTKAAAARRS